jgi:hypothetical protein
MSVQRSAISDGRQGRRRYHNVVAAAGLRARHVHFLEREMVLGVYCQEPGLKGVMGKCFLVSLAGKNVFSSSIDNLIIYS